MRPFPWRHSGDSFSMNATERTSYRVAFLNFWDRGGMRHYSESLIHALSAEADLSYVRNYPGDGSLKGYVADLTLNPFRIANYLHLARLGAALFRLKPDAIHLNSENPHLVLLYPALAFTNSVITLHDARPHPGERRLKKLFHWIHLALVFVFIRKVVVHSEAIRAQLPGLFGLKCVHVLPHINYNLWAAGKAPAPEQAPFTILFFGRILEYKGLDYLVEAFQQLDPALFRLIIAGQGPLPATATRPNILVHPGFVAEEAMVALFNQANVVALPYTAASQSGVAYMAFAFDRPVIATRVGALPEVVLDGINGLLVEPRSASALAEAIQKISQPGLCASLAANIKTQNLSSDEFILSAMMAIYRE